MEFPKTRKLRLFYETYGTGNPLILIPGFASGAWSWKWQIADLSDFFQVIVFDPQGIGNSPNYSENLSLQVFIENVGNILDELEIEKADILGASFGGFVAQEFALKFPEKVNKLILACTSAGGVNHVKPTPEILQSFVKNADFTLGEQIRHFFRPAFTESFNRNRAEIVEEVCRLREANEVSDETYFAQLQTALDFDATDRLTKINHQTLVITGDRDNLVPMENSTSLVKNLPNAELKIITNGSHMFFIENADEFNKSVREFLQNE